MDGGRCCCGIVILLRIAQELPVNNIEGGLEERVFSCDTVTICRRETPMDTVVNPRDTVAVKARAENSMLAANKRWYNALILEVVL